MANDDTGQPPPPHEAVVAANVRQLREGVGISQAELAARATAAGHDLGEMAVWGIENNRRRIRVEDLYALGGVLGVDAADLLRPDAGAAPAKVCEVAFDGSLERVEADAVEWDETWVRFLLRGEVVYFASAAQVRGVRVRADGAES